MTPRVSVLLPVGGDEPALGEALGSIAAQTLRDHEVLVVLNGASAATREATRAAARDDGRVRVLELQEPDLVGALNAGLEAARTDRIARLDADDVMRPARLERQVDLLERRPDLVLVTCLSDCTAAGGGDPGPGMLRFVGWLNGLTTPERIRASRFVDAPVVHPGVLFRRSSILEAGGYRRGDFGEDHDLWLRLLVRGPVFGRVPELLVDWRDRPERMTRRDPRFREEARRRLVAHHLVLGPLEGGRRPCRIWGAGKSGRLHARAIVEAGGRVDDLLDIDPKKFGRTVAGGLPVLDAAGLGPPDGRLVLVSVSVPGAREAIAARLGALGYQEDSDFLALR